METISIGELAREADVNIETIRFYERRGMIDKPPRRSSGYRAFSPGTVQRVRFIKEAQKSGFTLNEIKELLSLSISTGASCADVRTIAVEKLKDIDEKIRSLQAIKKALTKLIKMCPGDAPTSECPILECFDERGAEKEKIGKSANRNLERRRETS